MCPQCFSVRRLSILVVLMLLSTGLAARAVAQSQEPKPALPATPVAQPGTPASGETITGVSGSSWQGPNFGVQIHWDPEVWSVEAESIDEGYDGLQIGTPISTVFIEAYDGFAGDDEAVPLTNRPLPVAADVRGAAGLFGLTASLPDGTNYRGVEYVECRTIEPGEAVLEIAWQAVTQAFNEDFANVEQLLAAIAMPDASQSAATPVAPRATPVA
jgi:hypothetical protein